MDVLSTFHSAFERLLTLEACAHERLDHAMPERRLRGPYSLSALAASGNKRNLLSCGPIRQAVTGLSRVPVQEQLHGRTILQLVSIPPHLLFILPYPLPSPCRCRRARRRSPPMRRRTSMPLLQLPMVRLSRTAMHSIVDWTTGRSSLLPLVVLLAQPFLSLLV